MLVRIQVDVSGVVMNEGVVNAKLGKNTANVVVHQ